MKQALRFLAMLLAAMPALAQDVPVVTDSRIKTLVYNENDVYPLLTHYGYQANIEFGLKERIETLSVGDRVGWQIIPAGRRLFIRPLDENAHTNMTVITNLHSYQFDLNSASGELRPSEALVYVVRFYYPEDDLAHLPPSYASQIAPAEPAVAAPSQTINYRYTYTGPDNLAPRKIYDDGQSTYLQLSRMPQAVGSVSADGREVPVASSPTQEGMRIDGVGRRFVLHYGNERVMIYNDAS